MEESLSYLKEQFQLADIDVRSYSPLSLAYIGDSIYDLLIRTIIMSEGNLPVQKMHKKASGLVKAQKQAGMMDRILPLLTDEEASVFRREGMQSHIQSRRMPQCRITAGLRGLKP